jgi:lycopene elongase/hydratase (dihydrobisanhydrobacterioruberin-forming)
MINILRISRPRFWLYLFGTYLVGLAAGASSTLDFVRFDSILFGLYFLLPANLLVYGTNDIFDFATDRLNPKKAEYETLVRPESHRRLAMWIMALNIPFFVAAFFLTPSALLPLTAFLTFSTLYSAPPVRAKTIPIVDSLFNILYVFPAAFGFQMLTGKFPPLLVMIAAGAWTAAMHAYSAVPDIEADREAGLDTIATLLGKTGTFVFCFVLYLIAAACSFPYLGSISITIGLIYCGVVLISYFQEDSESVFEIYSRFPLLNAGVGLALFWFVAISNLF